MGKYWDIDGYTYDVDSQCYLRNSTTDATSKTKNADSSSHRVKGPRIPALIIAFLHYIKISYWPRNSNCGLSSLSSMLVIHTSSTAQGGGGSFKDRKPVGGSLL